MLNRDLATQLRQKLLVRRILAVSLPILNGYHDLRASCGVMRYQALLYCVN